MIFYKEITVPTSHRCHWVDVTGQVQRVLDAAHIKNGLCMVSSLHTTAGVTVNENADPSVERDFFYKLEKMVPQSDGYRHGEGNSDSHIKSSLVGLSATVPVVSGELRLGTWQSVYLCEFDGPRSRQLSVTITGE